MTTKNNTKSNVVSLAAARKKKEQEDRTQSTTLKPAFDAGDFFAGVIEQNRKAAKAQEEARKKRNRLTKRRTGIKEGK